jgi:putative peptidoglycan lipid II flippase
MAAFILSNITGLIRQILVSRAFGTGAEIDAFNAAARLPELLFSLVAGGALASAFIPTFTDFLTREDRRGAWQLASSIANIASLILAIGSLIAAIFAPQFVKYVVYILVPDQDPAQFSLTVSILRIMLISPLIFGLSGLLMSVLNAHQIFLLPALAPTMYWSGMIFGVLVLVPQWGIYGLAWGAVLGAILHLGIQLPALKNLGLSYLPTLGLRIQAVRQVGRLMAPRLLGVAVVQINFLVNTILASAQPRGSLTAITMAWAVMTMPLVVIAQATAIACLPIFSAQVARGRLDELRASLAATLRSVIFLSLPASAGLVLLRYPIVSVLFERGEFGPRSGDLVAWALLWYATGLVGHSMVEILARAFYALQDTKTPVFVGVGAMTLNLVFSVTFAALFARSGWAPHGGLALANSVATALETILLLILIRNRLDGLDGRFMMSGAFQAILATGIMSLGLWFWLSQTIHQPAWIVLGGGLALGPGLYAVSTLLMGVSEARGMVSALARRWKNV